MRKLLILASFLSLNLAVSSCEEDPASSQDQPQFISGAGNNTSTPAHPVFVFANTASVKGKGGTTSYPGVAVMDSNGAHLSQIYTSSSTSYSIERDPCWSPDGNTVAFIEKTALFVYNIRLVDVSVNSSGVVTTSNLRTVYSTSASDSSMIMYLSWSNLSSTEKFAFTRKKQGSYKYELCTISTSGGSPTVIYDYTGTSLNAHFFLSPDWNADDSKIMFAHQKDGAFSSWLKSIDLSTSAVDSTDATAAYLVNSLECARSGNSNVTVRWNNSSSGPIGLYYWNTSTGSLTSGTPSSNMASGGTWSPNNNKIYLIKNDGRLVKVTPLGIDTTSVATGVPTPGMVRSKLVW